MLNKVRKNLLLLIGIIMAALICTPLFLLGENSVITYHDQLDGEILTYIINAKYLFNGVSSYPELMNGIPKEGLVSPAPAFVILYKLFRPFQAFLFSAFIIKVVAFVFMFLLVDYLLDDRTIGLFMGILFMLLPFYPVYGLSIPGQPMLWYAVLRLKNTKQNVWINYLYIVFYGLCSSFALVGFACFTMVIMYVIKNICDKKNVYLRLRLLVGCIMLLSVYLLTNMGLITQIVAGRNNMQYISHRSETIIGAVPFTDSLKQAFLYGTDYAQGGQIYFMPIILAAVLIGCFELVKDYF